MSMSILSLKHDLDVHIKGDRTFELMPSTSTALMHDMHIHTHATFVNSLVARRYQTIESLIITEAIRVIT
jgi:hypothetical protein